MNSPVIEKILEGVDRLRRIYRENGIQYAMIYALDMLGEGLSFSSIKLLYELIVGHRVSNGTVGDLLRRLLRKGIVRRVNDRYYLSVDVGTAKTIIDVKRARNGVRGACVARNGYRRYSTTYSRGKNITVHVRRARDCREASPRQLLGCS